MHSCDSEPHGGNVAHSFRLRQHKRNSAGWTATGCGLRSQLIKASPELGGLNLEEALRGIQQLKEQDPLAILQEDSLAGGEKGGQFNLMKLAPNFEMAMYLAQATGACIVTDSLFRWTEVKRAIRQRVGGTYAGLATLDRRSLRVVAEGVSFKPKIRSIQHGRVFCRERIGNSLIELTGYPKNETL